MKYGQIAGSRRINAFIHRCFEYICEQDERKFLKKFAEQPHDSNQIMHTFRELILGTYLNSNGFEVRHDHAVNDQTPDWCMVDDKSAVKAIFELTNFHIDKATENEIKEQLRARDLAAYWRDKNKDNVARLYRCIWNKAQVYGALAKRLRVPYVVAVFGEFQAAVDFEEVRFCLFDEKLGLFEVYPELSGVMYFEESRGWYLFSYSPNPNALHEMDLPNGVFPPDKS